MSSEEECAKSNLVFFLEKAKKIVAQEKESTSFNHESNGRTSFNLQLIEELTKDIEKRNLPFFENQ